MAKKEIPLLQCSFCGKTQDQVQKLIAGPGIYICDECVHLCNEILIDEGIASEIESQAPSLSIEIGDMAKLPTPIQIKEHLDEYVIGNEEAKKTMKI